MGFLLLVNGPPGAGKSTVARRFSQRRERTTYVDVDELRARIDGWRDDLASANVEARAAASAVVAQALGRGDDVVVAQLVGRRQFLDVLASVANDAGVPMSHVMLQLDRETAWLRFTSRDGAGIEVAPGAGTRATFDELCDRLESLDAAYTPVDATGEVDDVVDRVAAVVDDQLP